MVSSLQQLDIPNDRPCIRHPCVTTAGQDRNMCITAFRVYHSTVQTLFSRLQQLDSTNDGPCSRRPCSTTINTECSKTHIPVLSSSCYTWTPTAWSVIGGV
jgi:hypothetical protein